MFVKKKKKKKVARRTSHFEYVRYASNGDLLHLLPPAQVLAQHCLLIT